MKISELQRRLDRNYDNASASWKNSLASLDMTGDFNLSDAKNFFELTTLKSTRNWAVSQELKANHDSMKKVIDSM